VDGVERLIVVAIAAFAAACLVRLGRGAGRVRWLCAVLLVYGAGVAAFVFPDGDAGAAPSPAEPKRSDEDGYLGSGACRSCHPSEHASWAKTFHRTMTQLASSQTVRAPIDGTRLEDGGRSFELELRGKAIWARVPDPDVPSLGTAPAVERRVLLSTGSHHYQAYWLDGGAGHELRLFPFVYLLSERRWLRRRDAFLQPPDAADALPRWNASCIQCHAVAGRPRHDGARDVFDSAVAELGIACEACHGPGGSHAAKHRDPFVRYRQRLSGSPDPSIVNPARLDAERASEVCGQCHSYFVPRDESAWWRDGFAKSFRPGASLAASRLVLDYAQRGTQSALVNATFDSMFWLDGTIRVGGREHNGLLSSPCFERGHGERRMSCLSCHSMHQSDPNDQLAAGKQGNEACLGCHAEFQKSVASHTHHAPDSSGSSCYACHMPYTSYAMLKAIRSHRIDSPRVGSGSSSARPDACSLCHTDRTLAWTQARLHEWYGQPEAPQGAPMSATAAALDWLLAGDAVKRVVVAYAMGEAAAERVSGTDWQAPFLAQLLDDPYAAVRFVAARSLRTLPGFVDFAYDFSAGPAERRAAVERAVRLWEARPTRRAGDPSLLLGADGRVDSIALSALMARRDDRPVAISE
jgi:predicted CXXCH cytochrome family protein